MEYRLVLASASPRRKQLMKDAGFSFELRLKDTEEVWPEGLEAERVAEYLACLKADAYRGEIAPGELLVTADTTVCLDGRVLGKPVDRGEAVEMLHLLSGRRHKVVSGVCLTSVDRRKSFSAFTDVCFKELSDGEIDWYVDHFNPYDKAGAYGIQEWIGCIGIRRIEGSFYNVMGLPVQQLYEEINHF